MLRFNESRRRLLQGLGASSTVLMVPGMAEAAKATMANFFMSTS